MQAEYPLLSLDKKALFNSGNAKINTAKGEKCALSRKLFDIKISLNIQINDIDKIRIFLV